MVKTQSILIRKKTLWSSLVVILCFISIPVHSRPQYSMLTGNRCIACHVNAQGSGERNLLGIYSRNNTSLFNLKGTALGEALNRLQDYHSFADDKILIGFDYRLQTARLGGPHGSERKFFSMQAMPYLLVSPVDFLKIQGQYNFIRALYKGQQRWSASVIIQPSYTMPSLKAGFIKPSIGNLYDDHTLLVRQALGPYRASPVLPPDLADWGAEINYEGKKWFSATIGIFNTKSMSEILINGPVGTVVPVVEPGKSAGLFRLAFLPRFFSNFLNTNVGASYYFSGDYSISDFFIWAGLTDYLSLISEYTVTNKTGLRKTNNYFVELLYQVLPSIMLSARLEHAVTDEMSDPAKNIEYSARQYVFGANIYPLPMMELRPEYRVFDRANALSYAAQWAVQLHLYY